jgi:hypothetical protein
MITKPGEVRRFSPTIAEVKATAYCGEHPDGEYVLASDFDAAMRAKDAEIADWQKRTEDRAMKLDAALAKVGEKDAEIARLRGTKGEL